MASLSLAGHCVYDHPRFSSHYKCSSPTVDLVAAPCARALIEGEDLRGRGCIDLGCGSGEMLRYLVEERFASTVVGIDASRVMLQRCQQRIVSLGARVFDRRLSFGGRSEAAAPY